MNQLKFFKGCLLQILLGPLLNTLSHILLVKLLKTTNPLQLYFVSFNLFQNKHSLEFKNDLKNILRFVYYMCSK